jgi:diguanylate cyclase (GGDEF)-like protein
MEAPGAFATMVYGIPYAVVATGMALSWRFNRSRTFFVLLVIAIAYWSVGSLIPGYPAFFPPTAHPDFIQGALCLLLPLNFVLFSWTKERGIFTRRGMIRFGVLLGQIVVGYLLWTFADNSTVKLMQFTFIPASWGIRTNMTDLGLIIFIGSFLALCYRAYLARSSLDFGLVASLLFIGYLLHAWKSDIVIWAISAAAGVLVIALVQDAYRKAYVDELTGLPGRRSMEEYFLRLTGLYSVAMVDIDHFKQCNDRYGHDTGDQVLRMIAAFLRRVERGGKPFRYGGEEFAIIFPGKEVDDVLSALDILREAIADNEFIVRSELRTEEKPEVPPTRENQQRLAITVSIGCAQMSEEDQIPADVIKRADNALYKAKASGRNRVYRA